MNSNTVDLDEVKKIINELSAAMECNIIMLNNLKEKLAISINSITPIDQEVKQDIKQGIKQEVNPAVKPKVQNRKNTDVKQESGSSKEHAKMSAPDVTAPGTAAAAAPAAKRGRKPSAPKPVKEPSDTTSKSPNIRNFLISHCEKPGNIENVIKELEMDSNLLNVVTDSLKSDAKYNAATDEKKLRIVATAFYDTYIKKQQLIISKLHIFKANIDSDKTKNLQEEPNTEDDTNENVLDMADTP